MTNAPENQFAVALIDRIIRIGTEDGDRIAYIECEFAGGASAAIAFRRDMASVICASFIGAAAHLEQKAVMRGEPEKIIPIGIAGAEVHRIGADGSAILSLLMPNGAALHCQLPASARDAAEALGAALARSSPGIPSPSSTRQ